MASFYVYDLIFLAAFTIFVITFLYSRRKNLKREGPMYLYKTKLGLKIIDWFGKKHAKFINFLEYVINFCGYLLMTVAVAWIVYFAYLFVRFPDFFKLAKIPPIAPLIPYFGEIFKADYLPPFYFTYWIVVLAATAIFHEFFHGIIARKNNVRIKSTGFAFLGPFLGAFVEQDEKGMKKIKPRNQMSILAAGSFANLLLTILFFGILILFNFLTFAPAGAIFNSYPAGIINSSMIGGIGNDTLQINFGSSINLTQIFYNNKSYFARTDMLGDLSGEIVVFEDAPAIRAGMTGAITEIDGQKIGNHQTLKIALASKKPGDIVIVKTIVNNNIAENNITLAGRPDNHSQAYLGIAVIPIGNSGIFGKIRESISFFRDPYTYYAPKASVELVIFIYNLIWWMLLINLSVAIFNMFPAWIFDGGRFFYLAVVRVAKSKKLAEVLYKLMTYLLFAILIMLTLMWAIYSFFR